MVEQQTRQLEVLVPVRAWGCNSLQRHREEMQARYLPWFLTGLRSSLKNVSRELPWANLAKPPLSESGDVSVQVRGGAFVRVG